MTPYTRTIITYESSNKLFQTRDLTMVLIPGLFNEPKKGEVQDF